MKNELLIETALMTDEERWEQLSEALRDRALQSVLAHYSGLVIEAGEPIPCPDCGGPFLADGDLRLCRDCGSAFREAVA